MKNLFQIRSETDGHAHENANTFPSKRAAKMYIKQQGLTDYHVTRGPDHWKGLRKDQEKTIGRQDGKQYVSY